MILPEKSRIELDVANAIRRLLIEKGQTRRWLAEQIGMGYGPVKRILNDRDPQQLSLTTADLMLRVLGTNLQKTIARPVIKKAIMELNKYQ
ncbi:hypothetical protein C9426_22080 [Serratia sp. S1B]|nr:hypothetical protein C9426_22080 [Serratia sp. S1B]